MNHTILTSSLVTPKKCVYLVGPGSTGKTTLANAVIKKCTTDTLLLKEVARKVLSKLKYNANDISNDPIKCYILQKSILLAQYREERKLLEANRKYISDRSAIDPIVYAEFFIKNHKFNSLCYLEEWQEMKLKYQDENRTVIVLIEPNEVYLKDDGTRKLPTDLEEWQSFYRCFVKFMNRNAIPFKVISETDIYSRRDQVIEWTQH